MFQLLQCQEYSSKSNTQRKKRLKKVLQVIKELNYQPNALARQLRTLETKTILVIVPDITNPFSQGTKRN